MAVYKKALNISILAAIHCFVDTDTQLCPFLKATCLRFLI